MGLLYSFVDLRVCTEIPSITIGKFHFCHLTKFSRSSHFSFVFFFILLTEKMKTKRISASYSREKISDVVSANFFHCWWKFYLSKGKFMKISCRLKINCDFEHWNLITKQKGAERICVCKVSIETEQDVGGAQNHCNAIGRKI